MYTAVPRMIVRIMFFFQRWAPAVTAIAISSGSPCAPDARFTSLRLYTTSNPMTAGGMSGVSSSMSLGCPLRNSSGGSARVMSVPSASASIVIRV